MSSLERSGKGGRFVRGDARLAGPGQVQVGDQTIEATRAIVLNPGSTPSIPPVPGLSALPYWTNRQAIETEEVPESLVVLGGGGIGPGFDGSMMHGYSGTGQQGGTSSTSDPLKTDFQKLQTDTQAIQATSQVTVAESHPLAARSNLTVADVIDESETEPAARLDGATHDVTPVPSVCRTYVLVPLLAGNWNVALPAAFAVCS